MDEENEPTIRYRLRSSLKKSSKTPLGSLDVSEECDDITLPQVPKRVSFAASSSVKPFVNDPERNTIWDNTYEEDVNHTDSNNVISFESQINFQEAQGIGHKNVKLNQSVANLEAVLGNLTDSSTEVACGMAENVNVELTSQLKNKSKHIQLQETLVTACELNIADKENILILKQREVKEKKTVKPFGNNSVLMRTDTEPSDMDITCQQVSFLKQHETVAEFDEPMEIDEFIGETDHTIRKEIDMSLTCKFTNTIINKENIFPTNVSRAEADMEITCQFPQQAQGSQIVSLVLGKDVAGVDKAVGPSQFSLKPQVSTKDISPQVACARLQQSTLSPVDMEFTCKFPPSQIHAHPSHIDVIQKTSTSVHPSMPLNINQSSDMELTCQFPKREVVSHAYTFQKASTSVCPNVPSNFQQTAGIKTTCPFPQEAVKSQKHTQTSNIDVTEKANIPQLCTFACPKLEQSRIEQIVDITVKAKTSTTLQVKPHLHYPVSINSSCLAQNIPQTSDNNTTGKTNTSSHPKLEQSKVSVRENNVTLKADTSTIMKFKQSKISQSVSGLDPEINSAGHNATQKSNSSTHPKGKKSKISQAVSGMELGNLQELGSNTAGHNATQKSNSSTHPKGEKSKISQAVSGMELGNLQGLGSNTAGHNATQESNSSTHPKGEKSKISQAVSSMELGDLQEPGSNTAGHNATQKSNSSTHPKGEKSKISQAVSSMELGDLQEPGSNTAGHNATQKSNSSTHPKGEKSKISQAVSGMELGDLQEPGSNTAGHNVTQKSNSSVHLKMKKSKINQPVSGMELDDPQEPESCTSGHNVTQKSNTPTHLKLKQSKMIKGDPQEPESNRAGHNVTQKSDSSAHMELTYGVPQKPEETHQDSQVPKPVTHQPITGNKNLLDTIKAEERTGAKRKTKIEKASKKFTKRPGNVSTSKNQTEKVKEFGNVPIAVDSIDFGIECTTQHDAVIQNKTYDVKAADKTYNAKDMDKTYDVRSADKTAVQERAYTITQHKQNTDGNTSHHAKLLAEIHKKGSKYLAELQESLQESLKNIMLAGPEKADTSGTIASEECCLINTLTSIPDEDLEDPKKAAETPPKVIYSEPMKVSKPSTSLLDFTGGLSSGQKPFCFNSIMSLDGTQQLIDATISRPLEGSKNALQVNESGLAVIDNTAEENASMQMNSSFNTSNVRAQRILNNIQGRIARYNPPQYNFEECREALRESKELMDKVRRHLEESQSPEPRTSISDEKIRKLSIVNSSLSTTTSSESIEQYAEVDESDEASMVEAPKTLHERILQLLAATEDHMLNLEHTGKNYYIFSTFGQNVVFSVDVHPEDGRATEIKSYSALKEDSDSLWPELSEFIVTHTLNKLQMCNLRSSLGTCFDVLSLLDHVNMITEKSFDFCWEFTKLQRKYKSLKMGKDATVSFEILVTDPAIWWQVEFKMASVENILPESLKATSKYSNIRVEHLQTILRNTETGTDCVERFIDEVVAYFRRTQLSRTKLKEKKQPER